MLPAIEKRLFLANMKSGRAYSFTGSFAFEARHLAAAQR